MLTLVVPSSPLCRGRRLRRWDPAAGGAVEKASRVAVGQGAQARQHGGSPQEEASLGHEKP